MQLQGCYANEHVHSENTSTKTGYVGTIRPVGGSNYQCG